MLENYSPESIPEDLKGVSWTEDIVFTNVDELEDYLVKMVDSYTCKIPVIIPSGYQTINDEFFTEGNFNLSVVGNQGIRYNLVYDDQSADFIVYEITYSAGENILNAIKCGDTSSLSGDEIQAYNVANDFITNTLDKTKSPLEQERQIFDYVCDKITYYNEDDPSEEYPRFRSCIGGLCDGIANCMGYTDTFYLLGSMAGLDVSCVSDHGMLHEWNLITLDGKRYLVDTTFSDDSYHTSNGLIKGTYKFFNAGMDLVSHYYTFTESNPTNEIVPTCDENYFYNVFTENTTTTDDIFNEINARLSSGETSFELFCDGTMPFNTVEEFSSMLSEHLSDEILSNGISYDWESYDNLNYFIIFSK